MRWAQEAVRRPPPCALGVIDMLEVVQVQRHQTVRAAGSVLEFHFALEPFQNRSPIP